MWITHGEHDHLLNVSGARNSTAVLRQAYAARGKTPEQTAGLVRYTEYADAAFSSPDYHAAFGPTYEDASILRWLLGQSKP